MSILCRCLSCDATFKVDEKYAGRKAKCPGCAAVINIPTAEPATKEGGDQRDESRVPPRAKPAPKRKPPIVAISQTAPPADFPVPTAPMEAPSQQASSENSTTLPAEPEKDPRNAPADSLAAITVDTRTVRSSKKINRKQPKAAKPFPIWLVWGSIATVALLALGGGILTVLRHPGNGERHSLDELSMASLVLDWPEADRREALIRIDGKKRTLADNGQLVFHLASGKHQVWLQRRGYEPIETSFSLAPGEVHRYVPAWKKLSSSVNERFTAAVADPTPPGFEGWTQRFNAALEQAEEERKDVLIAFVGSDWNESSMALARQVFPDAEFHRRAKDELVLVVIDSPQSQRAYEAVLDSAQNAMLREEYHVTPDELPTIVMLDSHGKPYALAGNCDADSAIQLMAKLDHWQAQRDERNLLFDRVNVAKDEEKLQAAVAAVDWLRERGLTRYYGDQLRQWEPIAAEFDPNNSQGDYEVLYEANWIVRWFAAGRNEDALLVERIVEEFDQWREKFELHDGDRAARMYLVAAASMFQLGRREDAAAYVEEGLRNKPKDQELLKQLQTLSEIFGGEVASGTGFVIAPGYLLTNNHVIEGPGRVMVFGSGEEQETSAEVIAQDDEHDIALLKVTGAAAALPPLSLAEAHVGRGAKVAAFGFPLGDVLGRGLKLTTGVVSALPDPDEENMYLLDCRVNPGNSGGPLCDQYGRVVGMVTAKSGLSQNVDSYGMALPANVLHAFLEKSLPGWTPLVMENTDRLEWDEVDRAVSSSVLMVVKKP